MTDLERKAQLFARMAKHRANLALDEENPALKQCLLLEAMRCGMAAWILTEADDIQIMEIWEEVRPSIERN